MPVGSPLSRQKAPGMQWYVIDHAKFTGPECQLITEFVDNRKCWWPLPASPRPVALKGPTGG